MSLHRPFSRCGAIPPRLPRRAEACSALLDRLIEARMRKADEVRRTAHLLPRELEAGGLEAHRAQRGFAAVHPLKFRRAWRWRPACPSDCRHGTVRRCAVHRAAMRKALFELQSAS